MLSVAGQVRCGGQVRLRSAPPHVRVRRPLPRPRPRQDMQRRAELAAAGEAGGRDGPHRADGAHPAPLQPADQHGGTASDGASYSQARAVIKVDICTSVQKSGTVSPQHSLLTAGCWLTALLHSTRCWARREETK